MTHRTINSDSLEQTHALGCRIGAALRAGHILALVGPLGSGKTTLTRGIAEGAGVEDTRQVNSPTFVLVNEYQGHANNEPLHIYHIDAYRLRGGDDLEALGFEEMEIRGTVLIEWADRVEELLPPQTLRLQIEPLSATARAFHFSAHSEAAQQLLKNIG